MTKNYLWIQTRDGSPTLWNNALGESFRSVKGAFTESWHVFIEPGFADLEKRGFTRPLMIGEFGLGPGTNWVLATLTASQHKIPLEYFCIERDLSSFEMGRQHWIQNAELIAKFFSEKAQIQLDPAWIQKTIQGASQPLTYASLEKSLEDAGSAPKARLWFHDPFGFDVNPEGYSLDTLTQCERLWADQVWGASYACNRHFQEALKTLNSNPSLDVAVPRSGDPLLKRERLEFWRQP